ncbi:MAG: hypothetical protein JWR88_511, partial [Pseudonocardia sp.]|nr:hypothetical protein [Pseudonocardia sp.]
MTTQELEREVASTSTTVTLFVPLTEHLA